jgi:alkylation response protein AidB-like acyl-CoA dehydrogenase
MKSGHDDLNEPIVGALDLLAASWRATRDERHERTHLDPDDFDDIRDCGFLRSVVPIDLGGGRASAAASVDPLATKPRPGRGRSFRRPGVLDASCGPGPWQRPAMGLKSCPGETYTISGVKHFGSGLGMADWMVTTAVPVGENEPAMFLLDVKDRQWDGSAGLRLRHEWDGMAMAATQSHGMCLDDIPAIRFAHDRPVTDIGLAANPFILTLFSAVIVGVLDEAIAVARARLEPRRYDLRPFEQVEWTASGRRYRLAQQALAGSIAAVQADDPLIGFHGALRAKQSIAEVAGEVLTGLCRVIGGTTFSRRSPSRTGRPTCGHWAFSGPPGRWPMTNSSTRLGDRRRPRSKLGRPCDERAGECVVGPA